MTSQIVTLPIRHPTSQPGPADDLSINELMLLADAYADTQGAHERSRLVSALNAKLEFLEQQARTATGRRHGS